MIRYFVFSIGIHAAALAAVFSVASLPHTDVLESQAGDTITLTFQGSVSETRQVVETVEQSLPGPVEPEEIKLEPESRINQNRPRAAQSQLAANIKYSTSETTEKIFAEKAKRAEPPAPVRPIVADATPLRPDKQRSEAPSASGGQTSPARNLYCPAPPYPERARRHRIEGQVRVSVEIGERGSVRKVEIIESSGRSDFDQAARKTILKHWRYDPALKWGNPIASQETVLVEFRLRR